jgi:hypothetical protein
MSSEYTTQIILFVKVWRKQRFHSLNVIIGYIFFSLASELRVRKYVEKQRENGFTSTIARSKGEEVSLRTSTTHTHCMGTLYTLYNPYPI